MPDRGFGLGFLSGRFPPGLLRRSPIPVFIISPGIVKPDENTTINISSLTPGAKYSAIINFNVTSYVNNIELTADSSGAISHILTAQDTLGKSAWDIGTYMVILMAENSTIGLSIFIVNPASP